MQPLTTRLSLLAKACLSRCLAVSEHPVDSVLLSVTSMSTRPQSREFLYGLLIFFLAICALVSFIRRRRLSSRIRPAAPSTPILEKTLSKNPDRRPGEWIPSTFKAPSPPPYPDWSIETAKPLPYRPFRYGPKYFVTMGLRPMPWDSWIELDNHYPHFHSTKTRRIQERGDRCCRTAPEAYPAAVELLEELCVYLPARYPSLYRKTDVGMDNLWSGESFDIATDPLAEDPMQMAVSSMLHRIYYPYPGLMLLPQSCSDDPFFVAKLKSSPRHA